MTKICEDGNWPKFVAKLPKPDSVLSPEQFVSFLLQDIAVLTERMESRTNWLFVLSHSVSLLILYHCNAYYSSQTVIDKIPALCTQIPL